MDLSGSMGYTYRQELTKFEYGISLAAALGYLMIHQQDPVGLVAFDQQVRQSLAPRSKRSQLGNILSLLARLKPAGETAIAKSLHQVASMIRHRSLVMLFSDLLGERDPIYKALHRLRFAGHDVIVFHILDEAEALFPFEGMVELEDNETHETLLVDADGDQGRLPRRGRPVPGLVHEGMQLARIDYIPLHTGMPFDKALMSYLHSRQIARLIGAGAACTNPDPFSGVAHGYLAASRGIGGRGGAGGAAGDPPPVHEADAEARHLPRAAVDPRTAEAVAEEAQGQELAAAAGADGPAGLDGPGPGPAAALLADLAGG